MKVSVENAVRNAEASLKMEGMYPSPEVLDECRQVLNGEISHEQYIAKLKAQYMVVEHV